MKIYQILNSLNEHGQKIPSETKAEPIQKLREQPPGRDYPPASKRSELRSSKAYVDTREDAFSKYYVPGKMSRNIDTSADDRMRRYSVNSQVDTEKMKVSCLGERSRREDSVLKNRDIDEEIRKIQDKIKKS